MLFLPTKVVGQGDSSGWQVGAAGGHDASALHHDGPLADFAAADIPVRWS